MLSAGFFTVDLRAFDFAFVVEAVFLEAADLPCFADAAVADLPAEPLVVALAALADVDSGFAAVFVVTPEVAGLAAACLRDVAFRRVLVFVFVVAVSAPVRVATAVPPCTAAVLAAVACCAGSPAASSVAAAMTPSAYRFILNSWGVEVVF